MAVYVDDLMVFAAQPGTEAFRVGARYGHRWAHLLADSEEELHRFARSIGMKRRWAQVSRSGIPHYDLVPPRRAAAVAAGALEVDREAARALRERLRAGRAA